MLAECDGNESCAFSRSTVVVQDVVAAARLDACAKVSEVSPSLPRIACLSFPAEL